MIVLNHLSDAQRRALVIADNRIAEHAGWDEQLLAAEIAALGDKTFDLEVIGFSEDDLHDLLDGLDDLAADGMGFAGGAQAGGADQDATTHPTATPSITLAESFGTPPFSILDAHKGWWQDRKRAWIDLGIRSELGRGEGDRACPGW